MRCYFYVLIILQIIRVYTLYFKANRLQRVKLHAFDEQNIPRFATSEEIERYAAHFGLQLKMDIKGPALRIDVFASNDLNELDRVGYLTAFLRPLPLGMLQLDTIQVKNRRQILGYKRKNWKIDGPGISFILGALALRWGLDRSHEQINSFLLVKEYSMYFR